LMCHCDSWRRSPSFQTVRLHRSWLPDWRG